MTSDVKKILITGAGGFIGRRMVAAARLAGYGVVCLDRSPLPVREADDLIVADIAKDQPLELPSGIDTVIHLAGKAHALAEVAQDEEEYFQINTEGTRRLLDAAQRAGVRAFVLFSTVKAMGEAKVGGPVDESCCAAPDTPYGRSKRAAEELVLRGGYVPHPVVLRPSLVYGPTPKGNLEKMIAAVRRGRFPPLPEVGNKRSMVHVDDIIRAAFLGAEHHAAKGEVFIVADDEPFSTRQLFEWICTASGRPVPAWSVPLWVLRVLGKCGDGIGRLRGRRFVFDTDALEKLVGNAWYSSAKLKQRLGWAPQHTLRETLSEMVQGKR